MDAILTIWPAYAPAFGIVSLGLAMRTLWGARFSYVAIWTGRTVFLVMVVAWEISTDSPFWIRALNGVCAAFVVSVVFSKILESLCAGQKSENQLGT